MNISSSHPVIWHPQMQGCESGPFSPGPDPTQVTSMWSCKKHVPTYVGKKFSFFKFEGKYLYFSGKKTT